ncbi:MAG: hypothetical protein QOI30_2190 [Mycobacterium sp.]|nr:hypothetical protein [Mycobacterium sp.]
MNIALAFQASFNRFVPRPRPRPFTAAAPAVYQIVNRLHEQRTVRVAGDAIAPTVSAWLAELGVESPMAEDLERAVRSGHWPAAYAIGEHLSVHVTAAASPQLGNASRFDPRIPE